MSPRTVAEVGRWLGPLVDRDRVNAGLRSFAVDRSRAE
jgi:hypothetical protein